MKKKRSLHAVNEHFETCFNVQLASAIVFQLPVKMKRLIWPLVFCSFLNGCNSLATGGAELSGLSLLHDRRNSDAILTDQRIEIDAGIELSADDDIHNKAHFNVIAFNSKVLITGEAPNEHIRNKMVAIVQRVEDVKLVHNHIEIAEPTDLLTRSSDALMTIAIKAALSDVKNLPGFDATRVKVATENSVVYLMGLLHQNEATVATEIARREDGVKKVVKLFEYLD